jgi:hypothetical protein
VRGFRFWIEVALAILAAALAMVTLVTREWMELLFGIDPDRGSGALEWAVVVASVALALIATWTAGAISLLPENDVNRCRSR